MPLKVYEIGLSQPARAVVWGLLAEKTPFEKVTVMPGKDTRTKEYAKGSPILTVPRIDDDGFVLAESGAILAYLGEKHSWNLYPKDLKVRARIHEYFNWHHKALRELTISVFAPGVRPDLKIDPQMVARGKMTAKLSLGVVERFLAERGGWLCGPEPTIADLSAYCEIGQCSPEQFDIVDLSSWPRILQWLKRCEQLPGFQESHRPVFKMAPKMRAQIHKANGGPRAKL
eukprot:TRINITY_DN67457_c0_g1_i1.p2 TRINITY_DN67457_c0_g1~~TRINITY_DN67457_c0_g1_i1.p2  ORF type:complete len:254 (+),score=86.57 TRINITY_DN67457_c0_g1_i1:76-762(+)